MMKKGLALTMLVFLLGGCAPFFTVPSSTALLNPPPPIYERSRTELIAPEFSREKMASEGLAILAILNSGGPEGLRQNAAFEIFQGLRASFPGIRVIPRSAAVERIMASNKGPEYQLFLRNYEERRSISPEELKKWGEIEGVRYLYIGALQYIEKHTEARLVEGGERSVAGKVTVFASGPAHIPEEVRKQIVLQGEIWDSRCGKVVWIGRGESEVTEWGEMERVRMEDIFIAAGRNLATALEEALAKKGSATGGACS